MRIAIILLAFLLVPTSSFADARTEAAQALDRWERAGIKKYSYDITWQGGMISPPCLSARVTISSGRVVKIEADRKRCKGNRSIQKRWLSVFSKTIPDLLRWVAPRAPGQDCISVWAKYDATLGYPTAFREINDCLSDANDGFEITGFRIIR